MSLSMAFTTQVNTTPERAFQYVADFSTHSGWAMDAMTIEAVTPGPAAVGSKFKHSGTEPLLRGRLRHQTVTITDIEAPRKFGFEADDGRIAIHHEFRFLPDAGGTRIERHLVWTKRPWWHMLLFPLLRSPLQRRYADTQARLKEKLETP